MKPGRLPGVLIAVIAFFALAYLALSLAWPVVHDLRILLYEGYLVFDQGRVPYRDLFDVNPPGTFLLFGAIHRATGGAQPWIRLLDLAVLAGIAGASVAALRRHGPGAGIFAAASFAAAYLATGKINTLQREYLCVLPLALSIALVFGLPERPPGAGRQLAALLCGLLAGLVFNIKPPLLVCWLPLLAYAATILRRADGGRRALLLPAALFAAGALLPLLLVLGWLYRLEALGAFFEMARNYYPLYTRIDGFGNVQQGGAGELAVRYLVRPVILLRQPLVFLAGLGLLAASRLGDRRLWPNARPWRRSRRPPSSTCRSAANSGPTTRSRFYALALCAGLRFRPRGPRAV